VVGLVTQILGQLMAVKVFPDWVMTALISLVPLRLGVVVAVLVVLVSLRMVLVGPE
jgi:hypothetical protein